MKDVCTVKSYNELALQSRQLTTQGASLAKHIYLSVLFLI